MVNYKSYGLGLTAGIEVRNCIFYKLVDRPIFIL